MENLQWGKGVGVDMFATFDLVVTTCGSEEYLHEVTKYIGGLVQDCGIAVQYFWRCVVFCGGLVYASL